MILTRRFLSFVFLLGMCGLCSAHILQNFALIDVRRSIQVNGNSVFVIYDCKLRAAAMEPPDKLIDQDGDGMARPVEKKAFFTQSRDYLVVDIYLMHNRDAVKCTLKEFDSDTTAETFYVVLEATLPAAPPSPTDELLILFDPVFLVALPTQQQEFLQTKVSAGPGVTLITEDKQRLTEMSVPSGPNMNLVFQRDAKVIASAPAPTVKRPAPVTAGAITSEATSEAIAAVPEPPTKDKATEPTEASGTKKLKEMISQKTIPPWLLVTYLCIAAWFGALHALTPGHGKTIVGAYLVGSRGRIRDAVYLGLIVTFTHTFSVIILGIIALYAADRIAQTTLYNWLGLASGFLVFLFGGYLFLLRLRAGGIHMHGLQLHGGHDHGHSHAGGHSHSHDHGDAHTHDHAQKAPVHAHAVAAGAEPHAHHAHEHVHTGVSGGDLVHSHGHLHLGQGHPEEAYVEHVHAHGPLEEDHSHDNGHSHDHGHSHGGFAHTHTHDGHTHTHEIPDKLTIKGLFALGISGGIVPCPDAIIVLLIAVNMKKIGLGLAMIGAFSIGLAAVLVAIGIMMVSARPMLERLTGGGQSKVTQFYLPVGSAFVVMLLGLGILVKVLIDMRIVSIHI